MKVWAVAVVVFFGVAELYQWLQNLTLPLPVYGVAGLLLALASNADHWYGPQSKLSSLDADSGTPLNATELPPPPPTSISAAGSQAPPPRSKSVELPNFSPTAQPTISFTIPKQKQE
jgi:hypothetical protein